MNIKIFLTGCTGQLGSRLTSLLLDLGYEVHAVSGNKKCLIVDPKHKCCQINLLDPSLDLNFQEIKPDILVHTSWLTTPKEFWNSNQNRDWVEASKRVISQFLLSGGKYVVVTGSCAEYSWDSPSPLSEKSLESPATTYGKAKLELLNWIRNQEIPFLWTRTFFQFGMKESPGRLIPDIIDLLGKNQEFIVQNPSDVRDFVFVEDVSKILSILISRSRQGVINIGRGEAINIGELARTVAGLVGREDLIKCARVELQKSTVISNPERLSAIIGGFEWTPLESALIKTMKARLI